jgi:cytochrome P450
MDVVQPFEAMPTVEIPEAQRKNPVAYLMRAAVEHGPIFRRKTPARLVNRYGPWQVYLVGPEANRFVLHTHRHLFAHAPGWRAFFGGVWNENLLYLDGAEHAAHRKIMAPAFNMAHIGRYLATMQRLVTDRIRDWGARDVVEVRGELRDLAFEVVAEGLLGFAPPEQVRRLHAVRDTLCRNPAPFGKAAYRQHILTYRAELNTVLHDLMAGRVDQAPDTLLTLMLADRDAPLGVLDDEHLLGHVQVLLEAGHTTTMDTATWVLGLLATHPTAQERVRAEVNAVLATHESALTLETLKAMSALGRAIDEAGRLRTAVDTAPRGTLEDVVFADYLIPKGTFVRLHLGACHRLPAVFTDPDRFDPERFAPPREEDKRTPYGLVTFGGGPRVCIGLQFAQVEIKALTAHLLRQFRIVPIAGVTPPNVYDPAECDDSLPRGLPLRFLPV